jgi:beta-galactosidase
VFREVAGLGKELEALAGEIVGARLQAKVALVFDWDSWWAVEIADGPSRLVSYQQTLMRYYAALYTHNVAVDVVSVDADLRQYAVVVAPLLHMVKGDFAARVEAFVTGGAFWRRFFRGSMSPTTYEMDTPAGPPGFSAFGSTKDDLAPGGSQRGDFRRCRGRQR